MAAPINVKLINPTVLVDDWPQQAQKWRDLNKEVNGNRDFYPLTIKFGYMLGIIDDICECVACLLRDTQFARQVSFIPAYGLFASGVELLGRCIEGEPDVKESTLRAGFKWLSVPQFPLYEKVPVNSMIINTSHGAYSIEQLVQLRNYAAHGQATSNFQTIDYQMITHLRLLLRDALQKYFEQLVDSDDLCNRLAKANVVQLRGWPVLKTWILLQGSDGSGPRSIKDLFDRFEQLF